MNQADNIIIHCSILALLNIKPLAVTTSLEETLGVQKLINCHHEEAIRQIQNAGNYVGKMTQSLSQTNKMKGICCRVREILN